MPLVLAFPPSPAVLPAAPKPPPIADAVGPDVGIEPECGWAAVASVQAVVPSPPASSERITTPAVAALRNRAGSAAMLSTRRSNAAAARTPKTTAMTRSPGSQAGSRPRSTADQTAVARTVTARTTRAGQ